jgi:peptidoglycan/LPS O-acetylase OafA/YrhL
MVKDCPDDPPSERKSFIDALRGWAAISVLTYHTFAVGLFPSFPGAVTLSYFQANRAAVLLFFVISGYVIGISHRRPIRPGDLRVYAWRRVLRIMPIYLVAVALGVVAVRSKWQSVAGSLLFLQDFDRGGALSVPLPGNQPLWSLHYEVLYYALFCFWWRFPRSVPFFLAIGIALGGAGEFLSLAPGWVASHAVGMAFWLSGLVLARCAPAAAARGISGKIAAHVLWLHATQHAATMTLIMRHAHGQPASPSWLGLSDFAFLPGCVVCVGLAGGCAVPRGKALTLLSFLVPAFGLSLALGAGKSLLELRWMVLALFLALGMVPALFDVRFPAAILRRIGDSSYGLYAIHAPILIVASRSAYVPRSPATDITLVAVAWSASLTFAYLLERVVQPRIRAAFARQTRRCAGLPAT